MRVRKSLFSLAFIVVIGALRCAFASAQSDLKAHEILQAGLAALGGVSLTDVTLTGTADINPRASHGPVPATLRAESTGSIAITYNTSTGAQVETHTVDGGVWSGTWSDPKGVAHPLAQHNMMTEPAWFFPHLALQRALSSKSSALAVSYVGQETLDKVQVQHLRLIGTSSTTPQMQAWSSTELYLDATTLLPVAMKYNDHPDNNVMVDIPVTIRYSEYTTINGVLLPARIQQLRNNALFLDIHIDAATFNTGLTIAPAVNQ